MSKELLIMRHAKSSWTDDSLSDHDRPLNKRGRRDAPRMAQLLNEWDLRPDIIISSTAMRARLTTQMVVEIIDSENMPVESTEDFYLAPPATYLETLQRLANSFFRPMVVGHNPGLEGLVANFTGQDEFMATAAIAHIQFDIENWNELEFRSSSNKLIAVHRPKEVLAD